MDGKPRVYQGSIAGWQARYDDRGNRIEQTWLGPDGKPCLTSAGCASIASQFDERGNRTRLACLDTDGKPCLGNDGYCSAAVAYDAYGNTVEIAYFGVHGEPVIDTQTGYHRIVSTYNAANGKIGDSYFDTQDKPMTIEQVVAAAAKAAGNNAVAATGPPKRVRVAEVLAGGQAAAKGVHVGDIFLSYAGQPITSSRQMVVEVMKPGSETRPLVLLRGDKQLTLRVSPGPLRVIMDEIAWKDLPPTNP